MQGQLESALKGAGRIPPKWHLQLIERGHVTLKGLLTFGVEAQAKVGKEPIQVTFRQIGEPFPARVGTGWMAVKVKSSFGGLSNLLFDAESGEVSGLLRLQR
jgi:hypothetical protein